MSHDISKTPLVLNANSVNIALHPSELIRRITKEIPRSLPYYNNNDVSTENEDPIVTELLKLHPHNSRLIISNIAYNEQVVQYSARLQELLYLLLDEQQLDDNIRINIESALSELTTSLPILKHDNYIYDPVGHPNSKFKNRQYLPTPKPTDLTYPNNYLSKILIDNFDSLIRFSKTYFNLSLASQITKYTVELIYQLYYWEVVHLVHLNPKLVDFLTLLKFEIINTSFGPVIRPPDTYLNENMLQGLQYPYPYPFYNYSYHSFDNGIEVDKFRKVKITPYMDITLKNYQAAPETRNKRGRKSKSGTQGADVSMTGEDGTTPLELSRTVSDLSDNEKPQTTKAQVQTSTLSSPLAPLSQAQKPLGDTHIAATVPPNIPVQIKAETVQGGPQPLTTFLPHARGFSKSNTKRGASYGISQSPQLKSVPQVSVFPSIQSPPVGSVQSEIATHSSLQGSPPQQVVGVPRLPIHQKYSNSPYQLPPAPGNDKIPHRVNTEDIRIPPISSASASPAQQEVQLPSHLNIQSPASESINPVSSIHSTTSNLNPIANYRHHTDSILPPINKLRSDQLSPMPAPNISGSPENLGSSPASSFNISKGYSFAKTEPYLPSTSAAPMVVSISQPKPPPPQPTQVEAQGHAPAPVLAPVPPSSALSQQQQMYSPTFNNLQLNAPSTEIQPNTETSTNATQNFYLEQTIDDKTKKPKSGVIHQCHLTDPNTMAECMKIFYGKNELLRHQEFVHATKKKIYKCIYCAKNGAKVQSYPRHDSLARHIRRKHGITGKENKMAVNYAKENVEIIDPDQLVTKQHDFQDSVSQSTPVPTAQTAPLVYSHPIRYGRPAPIPSYLQHRRLNLFPQTHRLNKGQQRAYAMVGGQPQGSESTVPETDSQSPPQTQIQSSFHMQGSTPSLQGTMLPSPGALVNSPKYSTATINLPSPGVDNSVDHNRSLPQDGNPNGNN